jgi:hypothetical protein
MLRISEVESFTGERVGVDEATLSMVLDELCRAEARWCGLGSVLWDEFGGDSFGDGEDSGGPATMEEGFQFAELGELLADGVGAFGVVGVVEGRFFWRGPAVGAGVVGFRQVLPNGGDWLVGPREELVHGHLLVDGWIFFDEDLDLIEE